MEYKITSINRGRSGFTLIELMVAAGLSAVIATAIGLLAFFSSRSFVAMTNYTTLAKQSQLALDKMSKEIRQAKSLTAYATNSITLLDVNNSALRYTFDPGARTLVRVRGGVTNLYLTNCDSMSFWVFQHTVISNTFQCYLPAYVTNSRVVQMTWRCSIPILGMQKANTDNEQSAQIALRNH